MGDNRHFGFIVYYDKTGEKLSIIDSQYATNKKDFRFASVVFKPEDITFTYRGNNMIHLVTYSQMIQEASNRTRAYDIRLIDTYEKVQYSGCILKVDGTGHVEIKRTRENLEGSDIRYNLEQPEIKYTVGQHILCDEFPEMTPFHGKGLKCTIKEDENTGVIYAELVVPCRLFLDESLENSSIGLVPYYNPEKELVIINSLFKKNSKPKDYEENNICHIARTSEIVSRVGDIDSKSNVYIVAYQENGETVSDPRTDFQNIQRPLASSSCFLSSFDKKTVFEIVVGKDDVTFNFIIGKCDVSNCIGEAKRRLKEGPRDDQDVESFLNEIISLCLEEGESAMQLGLDALEEYQDRIEEERFYAIQFRLLLKYSSISEEGEELSDEKKTILNDTIRCIDKNLEFADKPGHRLTLLLEKSRKQIALGQDAKKTLNAWMTEYETLVEEHPEKKKGLETFRRLVMRRLEAKDNEIDIDELWEERDSLRSNVFVEERLGCPDFSCCNVFGEDYARFDDLDTLFNDEGDSLKRNIAELERFLTNPPNITNTDGGKEEEEWSLAGVFDRLIVVCSSSKWGDLSPEFEKRLKDARDKHIRKALFLNVIDLLQSPPKVGLFAGVREVVYKRNTALFICSILLSDTEIGHALKTNLIIAALGTTCLDCGKFNDAYEGRLTLKEVLLEAQKKGRIPDCARVIAMLATQPAIRPFAERLLALSDWSGLESLQTEFYDSLDKLAGEKASPRAQLLTEAADCFSNIVEEFEKVSVKPSGNEGVSDIAQKFLEQFEKLSSTYWFVWEGVTLDRLNECFSPLRDYDVTKRFEHRSRITTNFLKNVGEVLETMRSRPSILSDYCFREKLEGLQLEISEVYRNLCQTTKPVLSLGNHQSVKVEQKGDSDVLVRIPVYTEKNDELQNAFNVRLKINGENIQGGTTDETVDIAEYLPSDGRSAMAEFTFHLDKPCETPFVEVQLEYTFIEDLSVSTKKSGKNRRVLARANEETGRAVIPDDRWRRYDITIEKLVTWKKKHDIDTSRLRFFSTNGGVDFTHPEVITLLRNREQVVAQAIKELSDPGQFSNGCSVGFSQNKTTLRPISLGRNVILYGQWRVGKTVILKLIEKRLQEEKIFPNALVLDIINLESIHGDFENKLARKIFKGLNNRIVELNNKHEISEDVIDLYEENLERFRIDPYDRDEYKKLDSETVFDFLEEFVPRFRNMIPGAAVILLVDEFTKVYNKINDGSVDVEFPRRWIQMISDTELLCVMAGGEQLKPMMQKNYNTLQKMDSQIRVEYLNVIDTADFVRYALYETTADNVPSDEAYISPMKGAKEALERIYKLTYGNPYLIYQFCKYLIGYLKESKSPYLTNTVIDETLDYIIDNSTETLEGELFHSLINPRNKSETDQVNEEDKRLMIDNQMILHTIIDLADARSHRCQYRKLMETCCNNGKMEKELFINRIKSLIHRKVIHLDEAKNIYILIDLYYELRTRFNRKLLIP